jgi:hypothetical protein
MTTDWLEELLQAAGRHREDAPRLCPNLAERVRQLHFQRARSRRATVGTVIGAALMTAMWAGLWSGNPPTADGPSAAPSGQHGSATAPSPLDVARLRAEIAQLDAEVRRHSRHVEEVLRGIRVRRTTAVRSEMPVLSRDDLARIEIEKTAFLLVDHADQRAGRLPDVVAEDAYRRVLKLFPQTKAAERARRRLNSPPAEKGNL